MIEDINSRTEAFNHFFYLWDQRVRLEFDYAEKLRTLSNTSLQTNNINIKKPNRPSQLCLTTLVNIIAKQGENHYKLAKQFNDEVYKKLRQETISLQHENKKNLTLAKSIKKDLQSQLQILQKNKHKYYKKSIDLQRLKLDYISSSLLQDRDFERKNKLFLKIKESENEVFPLRKNYENTLNRYSDTLSATMMKFSQLLKKIEEKQLSVVKQMKNSLINSQLFVSALGAILVHQTQTALSFLNQISDQQAQIRKQSQKQVEEQRLYYQNLFFDPSEYVDQLFRKIQQNSIEQIVNYGKNPDYKKQLSQYFENPIGFQDLKNLKVINDYTVRIIEIFKSVFEGEGYSSSTLIEFRQLIKAKPSLRKDFIFCLQKYRLDGKFQIHKQNFDNIVQLLNIFLNVCFLELDTYNSKQFMVLSFTYYFINQSEQKIDLQHYVKSHKIWHNLKWWQCSLLQSVFEQHKVKKRKSQHNPTFSLWDIKSSCLKKIQTNEQNFTVINICFNQLAYYVHNMQLFDLNNTEINIFAQKYIKIFGFSTKMANDILNMCISSKNSLSNDRGEKNN